jgi:phosphoribosyl-ATP pyrophosphohydrolase/phosphoribosyl-AMP cyclohydrolase
MNGLRPESSGRVPAIVQDRLTGRVRTLAWMTPEGVAAAVHEGRARLISGSEIAIERLMVDCDGDAVLVLVDAEDPACSKGHLGCFATEEPDRSEPFLGELSRTITERRKSTAAKSYTKSLLESGSEKIGEKLREEADELARAVAAETEVRVANEAADLLFHLLVALELRGVALRTVIEVLAGRSGTSGHQEKASRPIDEPG